MLVVRATTERHIFRMVHEMRRRVGPMTVVVLTILLLLAVASSVVMGVALVRVGGKLLQQDDNAESIVDALVTYRDQLRAMVKGEFLGDHPEVTAFLRLNERCLADVARLVEEMNQQRALERPREKLPRPDLA